MIVIIVICIIVIIMFYVARKIEENRIKKMTMEQTEETQMKKNTVVRATKVNSGSALQESGQIELHLNSIYETYVEMKEIGLGDRIISITLFPSPSRVDNRKLGVGISIQFDGTWFWSYIKNDFIPTLYEIGMYEDFREWKSVGVETSSHDTVRGKIRAFLQNYKVANAEKGEFLNLLHAD